MKKPRIILFDLETSPILSYNWGRYEQNAVGVKEDWRLLSFAHKALGEKTARVLSQKSLSERQLVKELWQVLNSADIIVAHNGDEFDAKKARAKFIEFGLLPPKPALQIDTKKVAKKYFRFSSNKLDDLGDLLGVGRKIQTGGFDLWLGCMAGDKKAWAKMEAYNKQDVLLLERIYVRLLPWINNHPNLSVISQRPESCPKCGGSRLKSHGYRYTQTTAYVRYYCKDCGGWCMGTKGEKKGKAVYK